jgi:hypothetical protein
MTPERRERVDAIKEASEDFMPLFNPTPPTRPLRSGPRGQAPAVCPTCKLGWDRHL